MRCARFLPVLLTAGLAVFLTGALRPPSRARHAPGPAAHDLELLPESADPGATALLGKACGALEAPRVRWLEAGVRQKVHLSGLLYEARGRYLLAPGGRFRLELRTRLKPGEGGPGGESTQGTLLVVGDGARVWQATRVGPGPWGRVTRRGPAQAPGAKEASARGGPGQKGPFATAPLFLGVGPLLGKLREQMSWVRREDLAGQGRVVLTGVWPSAGLPAQGRAWPDGLPRWCRLTLDARTLWPGRVEWWGPCADRGGEVLLAEVDFDDPVINRELPPARCAEEFRFDPGPTRVTEVAAAQETPSPLPAPSVGVDDLRE